MSSMTGWPDHRRITIRDLQAATDRGERWAMLTSYDTLTAGVFEQAGVRALLVGVDLTGEYRTVRISTLRQQRPRVASGATIVLRDSMT